jgi:hypothetical protein
VLGSLVGCGGGGGVHFDYVRFQQQVASGLFSFSLEVSWQSPLLAVHRIAPRLRFKAVIIHFSEYPFHVPSIHISS